MPTIAISGAGSGIGRTFLEFVARDTSTTIHAINATYSEQISNNDHKAKIIRHECNSSSNGDMEKLGAQLKSTPIDMFIHCAAVQGLVPFMTEKSDNPSGAETLDVMDGETFSKTLQVNILGSFLLIHAPSFPASNSPTPNPRNI